MLILLLGDCNVREFRAMHFSGRHCKTRFGTGSGLGSLLVKVSGFSGVEAEIEYNEVYFFKVCRRNESSDLVPTGNAVVVVPALRSVWE